MNRERHRTSHLMVKRTFKCSKTFGDCPKIRFKHLLLGCLKLLLLQRNWIIVQNRWNHRENLMLKSSLNIFFHWRSCIAEDIIRQICRTIERECKCTSFPCGCFNHIGCGIHWMNEIRRTCWIIHNHSNVWTQTRKKEKAVKHSGRCRRV